MALWRLMRNANKSTQSAPAMSRRRRRLLHRIVESRATSVPYIGPHWGPGEHPAVAAVRTDNVVSMDCHRTPPLMDQTAGPHTAALKQSRYPSTQCDFNTDNYWRVRDAPVVQFCKRVPVASEPGGVRGIDPPVLNLGDNLSRFSGKTACKNYLTWSVITTNK